MASHQHRHDSAPSDEGGAVLIAGWAIKEGLKFKTWKKRYFILRERLQEEQLAVPQFEDLTHVLVYYRSPSHALQGHQPLGAILISKSRTSVVETVKKNKRSILVTTRLPSIDPSVNKDNFIPRCFIPLDGTSPWLKCLTTLTASPFGEVLRRQTFGTRKVRPVSLLIASTDADDDAVAATSTCQSGPKEQQADNDSFKNFDDVAPWIAESVDGADTPEATQQQTLDKGKDESNEVEDPIDIPDIKSDEGEGDTDDEAGDARDHSPTAGMLRPSDVFEEFNKVITPETTANVNGVFLLKVTNKKVEIERWTLDLKNEHGRIVAGDGDLTPDVTITLNERTLMRWLNQKLSVSKAFMLGKIKVEGNAKLPLKLIVLEPIFDQARKSVLARNGSATKPLTKSIKPGFQLLKAGWGMKEGGTFPRTWKRRFFVLRTKMQDELESHPAATHVLLYFDKREHALKGDKPTGAFVITKGATIVGESRRSAALARCISLETPGIKRTYWFQPEGDISAWQQILTDLAVPHDPEDQNDLDPEDDFEDTRDFQRHMSEVSATTLGSIAESCLDEENVNTSPTLEDRIRKTFIGLEIALTETLVKSVGGVFVVNVTSTIAGAAQSWTLDLTSGSGSIVENSVGKDTSSAPSADTTVTLSDETIEKWFSKIIDPLTALMEGKLVVEGDQMKMMSLISLEPSLQASWQATSPAKQTRTISLADRIRGTFSGLESALTEDLVKSVNGVFVVNVTSATDGAAQSWTLDLTSESGSISEVSVGGESVTPEADTTVTLSDETIEKWFNKELNPLTALMEGKLVVDGDQMKMMSLISLEPSLQTAWQTACIRDAELGPEPDPAEAATTAEVIHVAVDIPGANKDQHAKPNSEEENSTVDDAKFDSISEEATQSNLSDTAKTITVTDANGCNVLFAGWGVKEGGTIKSWRRRFFVLRTKLDNELKSFPDVTHVLLYFGKREDAIDGSKPTGAVAISKGKSTITEVKRGSKICIAVSTPGIDRTYFFRPESSIQSWLSMLNFTDEH